MNYEDLSEELKAKAKACETPDEILALAKEEGYELSDEELEGVNGGWGGAGCARIRNAICDVISFNYRMHER